jgi:hypothetical protein
MRGTDLSFAFSQPRLQSRFGRRPAATDWRRLEAIKDTGVRLQAIREGPFGSWVSGLGPTSTVEQMERRLREGWTQAVEEVAGWQPRRWRAAVRWLSWLPYLPALQKLARSGRPRHWMRNDPVLGEIVAGDPRERRHQLERTPLEPLIEGFDEQADVAGAWARHWRSLWPDTSRDPTMLRLAGVLREHRRRLADLPETTGSEQELIRLEGLLRRSFRRHPLSAVACTAYLGLLALDALRLRGTLVTGALRERGGVAR